MSDMLSVGMDWLNSKRRAKLSTDVNYRRGDLQVDVPATFAATAFEVLDENGVAAKAKSVDFIIACSDLNENGFGEPQLGDKIAIITGKNSGQVYEVLELVGGGHYRPHDPYGNAVRIHTKLVDPCEG